MQTDNTRRNGHLARLIANFNVRPDRSVDQSWPASLWPTPWCALDHYGRRGRLILNDGLLRAAFNVSAGAARWDGIASMPALVEGLKEASLEPQVPTEYDFASRDRRLALLPQEALGTLAQLCGLCLHKSSLKGVLSRSVAKAMRHEFGAETLAFVLERTPPFDAVSETLEPLRRYPKLAVQRIHMRGSRLLLDFVATENPTVVTRMRLKLPRRAGTEPAYRLNQAQHGELAELLFLCLIPERLQTWDWLF